MRDVVTIDGDKLGKLVYAEGNVIYIQPVRPLKAYYVNDPSFAGKVLQGFFEEREKDPKHRKVLVALMEVDDPFPFHLHPQHPPFFNSHNQNPDVLILLYDKNGNPVPVEALLSDSPHERSKIAQLHRFYIAQRAAFDKLARTVDTQRQLIAVLEDALEYRDAEVEALMNANRELVAIMNSLSNEVQTLRFHILDMETKLKAALASRDEWVRVASDLLEKTFPALVNTLNRLADQVSSEIVTRMRSHVQDLKRESVIMHTIEELRRRIKEQTEAFARLTGQEVKALEEKGGEGEEGGKEGGGSEKGGES